MTTGFFGKIPTTGDFVTRNLPPEFVRPWDMWVAQHLMPFVSSGEWAEDVALFFIAGSEFHGPMAGIIVPSRDSVGRRFPLTIAAPVERADTALLVSDSDWLQDISDAALVARRGEVTVDALEAFVTALPEPVVGAEGHGIQRLCCWITPDRIADVDPASPETALSMALALGRPSPCGS